jgi:hypothetical protein
MEALYNKFEINLNELFKKEKIDLRESLNCWVTNKHKTSQFENILIIEIIGYKAQNTSLENIFRNLFISISVIEQLGISIKSIAMTALGTGQQNLDFTKTINALLTRLSETLKNNSTLERILFVEYNQQKSIDISEALDSLLNRTQTILPVNDVVSGAKAEILQSIQNNASPQFKTSETYKLIRHAFDSRNTKSVIYGIACRRLTERLLNEIYDNESDFGTMSLFHKIKRMSELNVAKWVISYLHVIRIFGNESAHEIGTENQIPKSIDERDLSLLLFCMQRIVEFWVQNKSHPNTLEIAQS